MSGNKILLVEDDQNFGDVLKSYLEMHDYDVTLASDGILGFESYRTGSFDLCIFDVMMPRKDGFTLARSIKDHKRAKDWPVIALSAFTGPAAEARAKQVGMFAYVAKFDRPGLMTALKNTEHVLDVEVAA